MSQIYEMLWLKFLDGIKCFSSKTQTFPLSSFPRIQRVVAFFYPPPHFTVNVWSNNQHNTFVNNGCTKECTRMVLGVLSRSDWRYELSDSLFRASTLKGKLCDRSSVLFIFIPLRTSVPLRVQSPLSVRVLISKIRLDRISTVFTLEVKKIIA